MDPNELKIAMMKLWKDTFHDCDEYISIVFDEYFSPDFAVYEEVEGKLVAALLSVPYDFVVNINDSGYVRQCKSVSCSACFEKDDIKHCCADESLIDYGRNCDYGKLKGLYLCGLATDVAYRRGGIMTRLIEKANKRAAEMGYDFTFLIPASDGLRKYYKDRGYVDASFRKISRYVAGHNFLKDYENCIDIDCGNVNGDCFNVDSFICDNAYVNCSDIVVVSVRRYLDLILNTINDVCGNYYEYGYLNYSEIYSICLRYIAGMLSHIEECVFSNFHSVSMIHSVDDYICILKDKFLYGGDVCIAVHNIVCDGNVIYSEDDLFKVVYNFINGRLNDFYTIRNIIDAVCGIICDNIVGSAFIEYSDDCDDIVVSRINALSEYVRYVFMDNIQKRYPDKGIVCYDTICSEEVSEISRGEREHGNNVGIMAPYGMMRLLNPRKILEYVSKSMPDCKFSILVDSGNKHLLNNKECSGVFVSQKRSNGEYLVKNKGVNYVFVPYKEEPQSSHEKNRHSWFLNSLDHYEDGRVDSTLVSYSSEVKPDPTKQKNHLFEDVVTDREIVLYKTDEFLGDKSVLYISNNCKLSIYYNIGVENSDYEFCSDLIRKDKSSDDSDFMKVSESQLVAFLFGRPMGDELVDSSIPVPRLEFDMSLLLD